MPDSKNGGGKTNLITFYGRSDANMPRPGEIVVYEHAYEPAIARFTFADTLRYVIPANRKWYRNWTVSQILIETMEAIKLTYPNPHLDIRALEQTLRPVA